MRGSDGRPDTDDWLRPGFVTRLRNRPAGWYRKILAFLGAAVAVALVVTLLACVPTSEAEMVPRSTLFIGVDVSGSFEDDGRWDDAMAFAAHYIYGHLAGKGELDEPRALFVGAIGGERPGEPQAFHPIHDFEGKTPAEIEASLRDWFEPDDRYTDFNAFFRRAAALVQQRNLVLAPITLVLLTDGVPDMGRGSGLDENDRYTRIDLEPLEYLARNVTVRVLYPDPAVAVRWERDVPRNRVRMWTVDHVVMEGWREQLQEPVGPRRAGPDAGPDTALAAAVPAGDPAAATTPPDTAVEASGQVPIYGDPRTAPRPTTEEVRGVHMPEPPVTEQPELWRWIEDNVDFRVGRRVF